MKVALMIKVVMLYESHTAFQIWDQSSLGRARDSHSSSGHLNESLALGAASRQYCVGGQE